MPKMMLLQIEDLEKSYSSPEGMMQPILSIPSFTLKQGEELALHGESGSGKTTFLNIIAGISKGEAGRVSIAGKDMMNASESVRDSIRAQHLGYVFQTFNLLQGYTALENVLLAMSFGRGEDPAYAKSLLERVGLKNRLHYLPRQMSSGQQQRVAVARALANHPQLILADEPTGNLDEKNSKEVLRLIRDVCRENDIALLLVSHDRNVLEQFPKCVELSEFNKATTSVK